MEAVPRHQEAPLSTAHAARTMTATLAATFPNVDPTSGRITAAPDLQLVFDVIRTLFQEQASSAHQNQSHKKELASAWLNAVQESLYAWKVADDLLQCGRDLESCYFAAQTLRTKIQHSFHELPAESIASLRDSIMRHLIIFGDNNAIQTQLCLAIVYLAILWPDWTSPIEDLAAQLTAPESLSAATAVSFLSSSSSPENVDPQMKLLNRKWILIELLTLMPEEISRSSLKIGANRREQFQTYLSQFLPHVLTLLNETLATAKGYISGQLTAGVHNQSLLSAVLERITVRVYRCFAAWINVAASYEANQVPMASMLNSIFTDLADKNCGDAVHDAASDAVCSVALVCDEYEKHSGLADFVLERLYALEPSFWESVSSEQSDRCVNFTRMFTEMAESIVEPLIVVSDREARMLELMLTCITHYEYEVAEITFHFWYRFAELVYNRRRRTGKEQFGHYVIRLLAGVTRHCLLESDLEGLIAHDSDIYEFRSRVSDLVKEISVIVGAAEYIHANGILTQIQNNVTQKASNWELVEADLFLVSCLTSELVATTSSSSSAPESNAASSPPPPNYELNSQIISSILGLEAQLAGKPLHPQLIATSCNVLAGLAPHFQSLVPAVPAPPGVIFQGPAALLQRQLDQTLNLLLDNVMKGGELSCIAAQALQAIVAECGSGDQLSPGAKSGLVTVLVQICGQLDHINNEATAQNLLQCCSSIISSSIDIRSGQEMDLATYDILLLQLITPNVMRLREILESSPSSGTSTAPEAVGGHPAPSAPSKSDPLIYLDRIAAIFRSLTLFHPVAGDHVRRDAHRPVSPAESQILLKVLRQTTEFIGGQLWPVVEAILVSYAPRDARVVERTCRSIRYLIRCLHPAWLLDKIATRIVAMYQLYPAHSSFLYIGSILVDEFASRDNPEEILSGLVQMLHAFCGRTFAMLSQEAAEAGSPVESLILLRQHPDTVDDFFRLCVRFYQKLPAIFLAQSPLDGILELTIACLALDHREANNSTVKFITELLDVGHSSEETVTRLLHDGKLSLGPRLVESVMNSYLFHLPSYFIPEMAGIFWPLIKLNREAFDKWLSDALTKIPRQTKSGVPSATDQQLLEFHHDVVKANHPKHVCAALRCLHLLYR